MIARGLILSGPAALGSDPGAVGPFTDLFITDRALIWDKMVAIFQGLDAWTYLKPANKNHDGTMGYKLIYNHHLGPRNIDHMTAGAEKNLSHSICTGEKRNWNFEKYYTLHKDQNNTLESLNEHGYTGINQISKVSYLNKGIKTTSIDSIKTGIMLDESLCQDFYGCVTLYKEFFKQSSAENRQPLVIARSSTNNASRNTSITFHSKDRYYDAN